MAVAVSAGTTTYALAQRLADVPGLTVVTNSIRVADVLHQVGRARPDDHPDRRRPDAVGRAGRAVRGRRPADRPRRPRLRRRPWHGPALRVHLPEPARGRHGPGAHRGRPAPRRRGRPLEVGGHRDQLDRPARPGGRPHHRRRARRRRPGRSWPTRSASWSSSTPAGDGRTARRRGPCRTDPERGSSRRVGAGSPASPIAATTRWPTSGCSSRPGGPAGRGWAPRSRSEEPGRSAYDPDCYLCPGNTRANGNVNPDYPETYVFPNDFAALRPDTSIAAFDDGLLRAEGERGACRVVCFSPRHDLTLGRMAPDAVRRGHRRLGRPDRRARRRLPLGPGLREPRRGDGRIEPAPARPDLGRHGAARRRRARGRRAAARTWPRPGERLLLDYVDHEIGRTAGHRRDRRVARRRAVLGGLAVRDAARSPSVRPRA